MAFRGIEVIPQTMLSEQFLMDTVELTPGLTRGTMWRYKTELYIRIKKQALRIFFVLGVI